MLNDAFKEITEALKLMRQALPKRKTVKTKTSELKMANESLAQANNNQLQASNSLLSEANQQLTVHDKMQKEFIIAAYELRTPTQTILGYSELMGQANPEEVCQAAGAILRNANRLERLTENILDFTRIEPTAKTEYGKV